jgi:Domain of unknown function (DUF5054)
MRARVQDTAFQNFTRLLLKVPEHTWGLDTKVAPAHWDVWSNEDFRAALVGIPEFAAAEQEWLRQAEYVRWAIDVRRHAAPRACMQPVHAADAAPRTCMQPMPSANVAAVVVQASSGIGQGHLQPGAAQERQPHTERSSQGLPSLAVRSILRRGDSFESAVRRKLAEFAMEPARTLRSVHAQRPSSPAAAALSQQSQLRGQDAAPGACDKPPVVMNLRGWRVAADACTGA